MPTPSSPRAKRSPACPKATSRSLAHRDRDRRRRCFSPARYRGASPRLIGLTWGAEDLSAELGAEANRDSDGRFPSLTGWRARSACSARPRRRCRRSTPSTSISATSTALRRETEEARRDGFTGKMAIHPAQVPVINEVFTPTPAAIAKARAVVAAFAANPGAGAVGIDGVMYDRPHLAKAQRLLGTVNR